MESRTLTFDQSPPPITSLEQVPKAINFLIDQVSYLRAALAERNANQSPLDRWLDIEELSEYLPGKTAITTIYGKVQRREIPFRREGKKLIFLQSEIDAWLKSKRTKTATELEEAVEHHKTRQRRGGRKVS